MNNINLHLYNAVKELISKYASVYDSVWANNDWRNPFRDIILREIPDLLRESSGIVAPYKIVGSYGKGRWTAVPWIAVFDTRITSSAQKGVYIVYLLNKDTKELYLTFEVATTEVMGKKTDQEGRPVFESVARKNNFELKEKLKEKAEQIRRAIKDTYFNQDSEINSGSSGYDFGAVYYKKYSLDTLPAGDELLQDLNYMMGIYEKYYEWTNTKSEVEELIGEEAFMANRVPWDKYEAAVLLDYCIKVENKELSKAEAISTVSQILRNRAIRNGMKIDEVFRNENGIGMQLSSIRDYYLGKKQGLTISKTFCDIVKLQKEDPDAFHKIIDGESEKMEKSNLQEFFQWLEEKYPDKYKGIQQSLLITSALCRKNHLLKKSLGEICDPEEIDNLIKCIAKFKFLSKKNSVVVNNVLKLYAEYLRNKMTSSENETRSVDNDDEVRDKEISHNSEEEKYFSLFVDTEAKRISKYTEVITRILSNKYKYGFRIGSSIELKRFRNYAESMELTLPETDEELEKEINAAGIAIDGKIYVFDEELLNELDSIVDGIFQSGVRVIFLDKFMEKHEDWLEENHIASESLLRDVLQQCKPTLYFGQNIITQGKHISEHNAIVAEIMRVAGSEAVIWTADIVEKLIYIPADKIFFYLSISDEFVRISEGKYFCMNHFVYSDEDAEEILAFVEKECEINGYVSITDIPMGNISEENFELSTSALYNAINIAILKGKYYLKKKIITKDENGVDFTILLKAYCQDRNECTIAEMTERAKELTGSLNKQACITILFDKFVRTDADRFVSEKLVDFDVAKIDSLLEEIIGKKFAPIRNVSTFALFPPCGLNWNYYLLESYCYRFSKKYRLAVMSYNDKNAGIIAATDSSLTYNDMLSKAVADADIELTPEAVGEYLFSNGYTAKSKYSNLPEIIEKAKSIREEKLF